MLAPELHAKDSVFQSPESANDSINSRSND